MCGGGIHVPQFTKKLQSSTAFFRSTKYYSIDQTNCSHMKEKSENRHGLKMALLRNRSFKLL